MPHLRLDQKAGFSGNDHRVTWAQASDLECPWEWMTGGELLLRNGRTLPVSAADQVSLIENLAAHDISGIVLGIDPETPTLRKRAIQRAEALSLPVMLAPYSTSFGAIGRAVAQQTSSDEARRVTLTGRVYDVIRRSVTQSTDAEPLKALAKELGCRIAVLDAQTGRSVLPKSVGVTPALQSALVEEVRRRAGALPGVVHLEIEGERAHVVEVPDEEPTVLVTYAFRATPPDIVVLQHVATAAAVLISQDGIRREHERRLGAELFTQILDDRLDEREAERQLAARRLSSTGTVLVAAQGVQDSDERRVHLTLHRRAIPNLLLSRSGLLYALLPSSREVIRVFHERLGEHACIGISERLGTCTRMTSAAREAKWAVRDAANTAGHLTRYTDSAQLSVLRDTEEAQIVVDRVLGELLQYDREHHTDLVSTLDTFLSSGRSWQHTAAVAGVHRQTVVYRMRRIEQITGRSLAITGQLAELWIALRARDIAPSPQGSAGT
ncbi:helix-turn-helix domain-containing protein [Mycolicibacterium neoaurum]|uniref:PucR family transcriptional regulator n=1 Tax=Mycolicibacterium neoaurum TaxID=1795 RepID=UPI0026721B72|nr:PucR family transcriptional regulator [Mycolicibacterium neoaurum]MDO3399552.1 helix-turn-helix domain-containing protein [Mycolicibacterium neoaurum]